MHKPDDDYYHYVDRNTQPNDLEYKLQLCSCWYLSFIERRYVSFLMLSNCIRSIHFCWRHPLPPPRLRPVCSIKSSFKDANECEVLAEWRWQEGSEGPGKKSLSLCQYTHRSLTWAETNWNAGRHCQRSATELLWHVAVRTTRIKLNYII